MLAVSPFNFTVIGGNLPGALALIENIVIWKPLRMAMYSNYLIYKILEVINLPHFVVLHFTGSMAVFKKLWKNITGNLDKSKGYLRIIGKMGGKNFHLVHSSVKKCSALLHLYVSSSVWPGSSRFKDQLLQEKVGPPSDFTAFMGPIR
ncbi:hypothetical protein GLOTRDRAFT_129600 [Gloeophyllum trabeum ATCC 11539]|uniref:Uncharacterized protein n=1 Tax=Gloeophyllum trabeum (strain ATCC 11539 / FP-39264 / Madison 617) TaxID=670483 RepID=S7Q717_GLOTA|nr:uncharacterized protein GLOTRDRAFT_129600 [Gloeophyllum trabeum ATCC 11539]EPQ55317.1 hypothetical protein GLOTRDRAFT_129600 [Gloeophyllum trabeum ATCC 11539]